MPYKLFDTDRIRVYPVAERHSKVAIEEVLIDPDAAVDVGPWAEQLDQIAERFRSARRNGRSRMLAYGAHLVKNGAQSVVVRLIRDGWLTHVATNGAGAIHDLEFSFNRRSTESVEKNVDTGTFGTWDETGRFTHLAVQAGVIEGRGYGESVGKLIADEQVVLPSPADLAAAIQSDPRDAGTAARADLLATMTRWNLPAGAISLACPYKQHSILAGAYQASMPATVHPGIGYDIIYTHPLANGGALGRAGYIDFRVFAEQVRNLSDGVILSVGSAIMAPQVYEKSQSIANNLLLREGRKVSNHLIAVVDIAEGGGWDWSKGEPPMNNPAYYLRYCKSFSRMHGDMRYIQMDNRVFLQGLYQRLAGGT